MIVETVDNARLQRKLDRESAARREAEQLLESKSRELYMANQALSEANAQLRAAQARAEEASKAKSIFIANMSHELLTPMNAIIGLSQLLQDTTLNSRQREYLDTISSSAQRLLAILHDILDISAIESGQLTLMSEWLRIDQLIDDVIGQIAPAARSKGIEIIVDSAPLAGISLVGDRERLDQSLVTLLRNAVKFTERGCVQLLARLLPGSDGQNGLEVSIRDTGIGIEAHQQQRIFELFEQIDEGTVKRHGGVGLGLPILKNLVGLMGGELSLSSSLGQGSTFMLRIPVLQVRSEPLLEPSLQPALHAVAGLKVLLVDDDAAALQAMQGLLRVHGMNPLTASGASEALACLHAAQAAGQPVALVLADLHLQDANADALLHCAADEALQPAPLLVCTTPFAAASQESLSALTACQLLLEKPLTACHVQSDLLTLLRREAPGAAPAAAPTLAPGLATPDLATLKQMLEEGDVQSFDYLKQHDSALRAYLGGDYIGFAAAIKHYDFWGAASILRNRDERNAE